MNIQDVIERLMRRRSMWLRLARANLGVPAQAEDVLHDAIVRAFEHLPPDHPEPDAWFNLTLRRCCWAFNKRSTYTTLPRDPQMPNAFVDARDKGARRPHIGDGGVSSEEIHLEFLSLGEALGQIKPDERTALLDRACGLSYEEILERRGWSYTKVNRCLYEGRRSLREALA